MAIRNGKAGSIASEWATVSELNVFKDHRGASIVQTAAARNVKKLAAGTARQ